MAGDTRLVLVQNSPLYAEEATELNGERGRVFVKSFGDHIIQT